MEHSQSSISEKLLQSGISIHHTFEPGDLGRLIWIHGVQNYRDYRFNPVHEAYCAKIAADFLLSSADDRSKVWLAKQKGSVVGSIFIFEQPGNQAQLRLLFVDASIRGCGLGRWLVEESVLYCRAAGFRSVFLWTVEGLDRAISIYSSLGFIEAEKKKSVAWGRESVEVRYELVLGDQESEIIGNQ
ncbi:MAG TPA: GNAT family N-acetyltransferase [Chthoniobacterales bacterium]|nr:GNAT family N-acetyltransferase [Chthoniobacterales bacterium]